MPDDGEWGAVTSCGLVYSGASEATEPGKKVVHTIPRRQNRGRGRVDMVESVLTIFDRDQIVLNARPLEGCRHGDAQLVRHIRICRAVQQQGRRIGARYVLLRAVGRKETRVFLRVLPTDLVWPDALLTAIEIEVATFRTLVWACDRCATRVPSSLCLIDHRLSAVERVRLRIPRSDHVAIAIEGDEGARRFFESS